MNKLFALLMMLAMHTTNGFFYHPLSDAFDVFAPSPIYYAFGSRSYEEPRSPTWTATNAHYAMKLRLPALEADSVGVTLLADEAALEISGKRLFDGCECSKKVVSYVKLPYRPREEDIDVTLDNDKHELELRLVRHAKAVSPSPLKIKMVSAAKPKQPETETTEATTAPSVEQGEGAKDDSLEGRELKLVEKFAAALGAKPATKDAETGAPADADDRVGSAEK